MVLASASSSNVGSPLLWGVFGGLVLGLLALDLGVFHRKAEKVSAKEALRWSAVWIAISLGFNAFLWWRFGEDKGLEFLTGYLIEKSLSVDNLFVFLLLFRSFQIPAEYQHKVLFWGIFGALLMRAGFIGAGLALLHAFHWVLYAFGALLLFAGFRLLVHKEVAPNIDQNPVFRLIRRVIPATSTMADGRFTTREAGGWRATPLLMALVAIELSDVMFAIDSIPAIFGVTTDPFIVFTSNIFALLGLRSLYFVLAVMLRKFRYLDYGLALVLLFIGTKMVAAGVYEIPVPVSLAVVVGVLALSIVASLLRPEAASGSGSESESEEAR